jgi:hypothetical protein
LAQCVVFLDSGIATLNYLPHAEGMKHERPSRASTDGISAAENGDADLSPTDQKAVRGVLLPGVLSELIRWRVVGAYVAHCYILVALLGPLAIFFFLDVADFKGVRAG